MNQESFERLERFNAQVDIWIDQEEYGQVEGAVTCSQDFQTQLKRAFCHTHCTRDLNDEWLRLLEDMDIPLTEVGKNGEFHTCFDQRDELDRAWSRLFGAKLVRAKIQEKGSDCYFRRLDEVISYLERHLPVVKPNSVPDNTLAIIYLLEMAAAGVGADQRSFSERARRVLETHFKEEKLKPIHDFYDLLARYNIGVGYQHEGMHRQAVREFNWIIEKIISISSGKQNSGPNDQSLSNLLESRFGEELLYLPAVLKRAGIQLKLQLAYHASKTLQDHWRPQKMLYLDAWRDLLLAEAFREMGELDKSEQSIARVVAFFKIGEFQNIEHTSEPVMDWQQVIMGLEAGLIRKKANLFGRLVDLMMGWCLERFKIDGEGHFPAPGGVHFSELLGVYWQSALHQTPNRHGFLEQVAECLALLVGRTIRSEEVSSNYVGQAREIYNKYRTYLLDKTDIEKEATESIECPCSNTGIDLRRLGSEHFDNFVDNAKSFLAKIGSEYSQDREDLWKRLFEVEKEHREDLACRKRKLILAQEALKEPPKDWCEKCVKQLGHGEANGFRGLLQCSGQTTENEDRWLTDEMYEHIMDHWDDHFVEHLRHPSFHEPRCRGLHFVGLQRWNSASPAQGRSVGGGYFIYHTDADGRIDLGVAVDPGFDFLRNLFHCGFSLRDIDVVLLSHAHVDHVRDFESMVALCLELKKRKRVKHKLQAIMTLGVYRRSAHVIQSSGLREFVEPYILDIEKEIDPKFVEPYFEDMPNDFEDMPNNSSIGSSDKERGPSFRFVATRNGSPKTVSRVRPLTNDTGFDGRGLHLTITATRAYHEDYSDYSDSFGFKIRVADYDSGPIINCTIGYTGDTAWHANIMDPYKDCHALIVHLGSLVDRTSKKQFSGYDENGKQCWALVKEKNHPYLTGMLHFLTGMAARSWHDSDVRPLVLVSEFGEELRGGIRVDLYRRLKWAYGCFPAKQDDKYVRLDFLPVDVGLDVLLAGPNSSTIENGSDSSTQECRQNVTGPPPSVWCAVCQRYVLLDKVDFMTFGHDEALFSVCQSCQRSTPFDVLQDRLRALYEVGTPLRAH